MLNSTKIVFLSFFSESEGKFYVCINEFVENSMEINILFTELKKLFDLSKYISKTDKNLKNDMIFSIIFFKNDLHNISYKTVGYDFLIRALNF
jgi:hypothetical protein